MSGSNTVAPIARLLAAAILLIHCCLAFAVLTGTPAQAATAANGTLSQPAERSGCIVENNTMPGLTSCTDGRALSNLDGITLSPDGKHAYTATLAASAIAVFDRNAGTGALTQKAGPAGCIVENNAVAAVRSCTDGRGMAGAERIAISPDGRNAYVTGFLANSLAIFDRNPDTGTLTQKAGAAGCIVEDNAFTPVRTCADGRALTNPAGITLSPDGHNVYLTGAGDTVAIFDRNTTTGGLTQKSGAAGCIAEDNGYTALSSCADGRALNTATEIVISPDGANAYVSASGSQGIAVLDRDTTTGALTQQSGAAGCIVEDNTVPGVTSCTDGRALKAASGLAISPNGRNVYGTAPFSHSVVILDREPRTGALTQKPGAAGCIAEFITAPGLTDCTDGRAVDDAYGIAVSPDGKNAYVTGSASVAVLDRDTTTGTLSQKPGAAGCIVDGATAEPGSTCTAGRALAGANEIAASPDGKHVYVTALDSSAVVILKRG